MALSLHSNGSSDEHDSERFEGFEHFESGVKSERSAVVQLSQEQREPLYTINLGHF
jgi:hypothetical protein